MPVQKQPRAREEEEPGEPESALAFVPEGPGRSIAEYAVAILPGALLLFAFFVAAETAVLFLPGGDLIAASFIPVVCIMPILSGVISTLLLEKLRKKPLTLKRGAAVGAAACLAGASVSIIMLAAISYFAGKPAFGSLVSGLMFYLTLPIILAIDVVLGALGGALVAKFITEP